MTEFKNVWKMTLPEVQEEFNTLDREVRIKKDRLAILKDNIRGYKLQAKAEKDAAKV